MSIKLIKNYSLGKDGFLYESNIFLKINFENMVGNIEMDKYDSDKNNIKKGINLLSINSLIEIEKILIKENGNLNYNQLIFFEQIKLTLAKAKKLKMIKK